MGWQDDPVAGKSGWEADPLTSDTAKAHLASEISPLKAALIGAGKMGDQASAGIQQGALGGLAIMGGLLTDRMKQRLEGYVTEKLQKLEQDQKSKLEEYAKLEKAHPIATTVGEVAPMVAAPMLRVASGSGATAAAINSAVTGAVPGLISYGSAEERGTRGGAGAAGGFAGSMAMSGLGKIAQKVTGVGQSSLAPEAQRVVQEAIARDIPLTAGAQTGNKAVQAVEAAMEWLPSTSTAQAAVKQQGREALTREVMKQAGETAGDLSPAAMEATKKRIGGDFERIFSKVRVDMESTDMGTKLARVMKDSAETLSDDQARLILERIKQITQKIGDDGAIDGKAYQAWRSQVQQQAEKSKDEWFAGKLKDLYKTVDEAAYISAARHGEDTALKAARDQYRVLKTVQPLAEKSTDGMVPPALLREAVRSRYPGFAFGGGEMPELARISRFVADSVPNSGTAQRQAAQALLTGTIGYGASGGDIETTAKAAAGGLFLPKAVQTLVNSAGGQRFLTQGFSRAEAEALRRTGGLAGLGVSGYLTQ